MPRSRVEAARGVNGCSRCGHDILAGQLWRVYPIWSKQGQPAHVACPTEREVQIALRWGRWV